MYARVTPVVPGGRAVLGGGSICARQRFRTRARVPVVTSTYALQPSAKPAAEKAKDPFANAPIVDDTIGAVPDAASVTPIADSAPAAAAAPADAATPPVDTATAPTTDAQATEGADTPTPTYPTSPTAPKEIPMPSPSALATPPA